MGATPENGEFRDKNVVLQMRYLELQAQLKVAEEEGDQKAARRLKEAISRNDEEFYLANKGLAYTVAKQFFAPGEPNSDDYLQDAFVGLLEARRKWDPSRGVTFGTYSRQFIAGTTQRGVRVLEHNSISHSDFAARKHIMTKVRELEIQLGRMPSDKEVHVATGYTESLVHRVRMGKTASLDTPVGDGDTTVGDLIADKVSGGASHELDDETWWETLAERTESLSAEELVILGRRTALNGAWSQSLVEIATTLGQGREPVRRAEVRARAKSGFTK